MTIMLRRARPAAPRPPISAPLHTVQYSPPPVPRPSAPPPAAASHPPAAAPPPPPPSWESDPILAQIRALAAQSVANAQASGSASRNAAFTQFGYDPSIDYGDPSIAEAAKQNPFSTLAVLAHNNKLRETGLNEDYNKQNLFYSGHRGQALQENARSYLGEQSSAQQALQNTLRAIAEAITKAQQDAQGQVIAGEQDAYNRWLQQQMQNPPAPPPEPAPPPAAPPAGTPAVPPAGQVPPGFTGWRNGTYYVNGVPQGHAAP